MTKEEVFDALPDHGYTNLIGTTNVDGQGTLEEWTVQALRYDRLWTGQPVEAFQRYLYFVDNRLADVSQQPLQYRDRKDLVIEWRDR